ncbi:hypothetical protein [Streptomyces sp. NPDC017448]|uniref:hypothetical protein n=1 Tax=Streptomyces sp. NPDC017448 TaxID=3364996 RepID=UPI003798D9BB
MSRLDWKRGRWSAEVEVQQIGDGLRGYQPAYGDQVSYWRFDYEKSKKHSVYEEAVEEGRQFIGPHEVPVLDVLHGFGGNELHEGGFYTNDTLRVTCGFRQLSRTGLTNTDLRTSAYLRDRMAYDGKLFRLLSITVQGQIQRTDVVVELNAVQLKPDEIVNDPLFVQYARDPQALARFQGFGVGGYGAGMYGD